jgi:hypothetical protein
MEHDLLPGVGGYKLTEDLEAEPTEDLFERTDDYYVDSNPRSSATTTSAQGTATIGSAMADRSPRLRPSDRDEAHRDGSRAG